MSVEESDGLRAALEAVDGLAVVFAQGAHVLLTRDAERVCREWVGEHYVSKAAHDELVRRMGEQINRHEDELVAQVSEIERLTEERDQANQVVELLTRHTEQDDDGCATCGGVADHIGHGDACPECGATSAHEWASNPHYAAHFSPAVTADRERLESEIERLTEERDEIAKALVVVDDVRRENFARLDPALAEIERLKGLVRSLAPLALDAENDEPYDWAIEEPQYWDELDDEQVALLREVMR